MNMHYKWQFWKYYGTFQFNKDNEVTVLLNHKDTINE